MRPGSSITYRIAVSNTGAVTATGVRMTDTLPSGVTFVTQRGPFTFSHAGPVLTWQADAVVTGSVHLITVTGQVTGVSSGLLTNRITVTTITSETNLTNNVAVWGTSVVSSPVRWPDLAVNKVGPESVRPGSSITYRIAVSNTGAITATGVRMTDTLPAGVAFVAQRGPFTFSHAGPVLTWQADAVVTGTRYLVTVTGRVAGTLVPPTALTNRVTVTTVTGETDLTNNTAAWETTVGYPGAPRVRISAVLYDGYQSGDTDEAVQLVNVGPAPADLAGWELCKDTGGSLSCRTLPSVVLSPTARIWLARKATSFTLSFGFPPDAELDNWLSSGLSNSGDEVVLRDASEQVQDAVVYEGGNTNIVGWDGVAVQPYGVGRSEGQILYRIPDEATGLPITDTDRATDWIQSTGDALHGRRVLYPGWDLDPLFWPLTATEPATVVVGIAPDNAFEVVSQTLMQARRAISVEVYSLRNPAIVALLAQKAAEGVRVAVLLEGQQAMVSHTAPEWQQELWACQQIEAAGGACWFMVHETGNDIFNRYDYLHAKFIVVDDEWLLVSSQNLTDGSLPADDKSNGTYGSRGVVVATNAPSVVARAARVFALDLDPAHHADIRRWNGGQVGEYGLPDPAYTPVVTTPDWVTSTVRFPTPLTAHGAWTFELFTAPEAALRSSDALLGLVGQAGAGDVVYVEQMYEYVDWGEDPHNDPNVRLEAYIAVARRGARVRILLNEGTFGNPFARTVNTATVAYVHQIAAEEGLDLEAALGDPTAYGIHNKMVLVWTEESGGCAHVGSINGSEGSSKVNREMALQVCADPVYAYLASLFERDWWLAHPAFLPVVMRDYAPPAPPVDYVVISEVMYRPGGQTSGNREWVELYNPTGRAFDLSGWYLGDAATVEEYGAGLYRFPDGTSLAAGGVLVIAQQAADFEGVSGFSQPDFEFLIDPGRDDPDIPNMLPAGNWDGFGFSLGDGGDKVILRDAAGGDVDSVVYGDGAYGGVVPHPGGVNYGWSLERRPPYYDSDDCRQDFTPRYPATPGSVPLP